MEPAHILVIEDDYIVARTIERSLRGDDFSVILASRGDKGLHLARQNHIDLVILDVIMPDMDGYQVCRAFRNDPQLKTIPILFLTARVKPQDKINGFVAGGDDYLCKPFNVDELILRVQAILRRTRKAAAAGAHATGGTTNTDPHGEQPISPTATASGSPRLVSAASGNDTTGGSRLENHNPADTASALPAKPAHQVLPPYCLVIESFILDTRSFELHTPQRGKIRLTPLQYDLLYHLMTHPGETFTPARLLDEVWDFPSGRGSPDLVRVHIKTLRERIESDPSAPAFIQTVPGRGYMVGLRPKEAAA